MLTLFNHAVVEFGSGFIRNLAHYQILDLLFQREDLFFVLPDLQVVSGFLFEPLLDDPIILFALGYYSFFKILNFSEHQLIKLRLVNSMRCTVLFAVAMIAVAGVFDVFPTVPCSVFRYEARTAFGAFYQPGIAMNFSSITCSGLNFGTLFK